MSKLCKENRSKCSPIFAVASDLDEIVCLCMQITKSRDRIEPENTSPSQIKRIRTVVNKTKKLIPCKPEISCRNC